MKLRKRNRNVILEPASASFVALVFAYSSAFANTMLESVDSYFTAGTTIGASAICAAAASVSPAERSAAIELAMRRFESFGYVNPAVRRPTDFAMASSCLWQASKKATPRGMMLGAYFAQSKEDRLASIARAAESGDVDAMWMYSREPRRMSPSPRTLEHSYEWQRKAAEAGHPYAQETIANRFLIEAKKMAQVQPSRTEEIQRLHQEALRWFEIYADNMNPNGRSCAQEAIPQEFFAGIERCALWISKGSAKERVARYYFEGKYGIPQDYSRADYWFLAAQSNGVFAYGALHARMYEEGLGVPRNPEKAAEIRWHTEAYRKRYLSPIR